MYINDFLGMEFTDDEKGIVFHFLNCQFIAEEYTFEGKEEATHFYMCCLRFFEAIGSCPPTNKQKLFRELLDTNFLELSYSRQIY